MSVYLRIIATFFLLVSICGSASAAIPELKTENGKHMMLVDGQPFLILGAQANNSANYISALKDVWPIVEAINANTLSIPVAWEQIEPKEGEFDFTYLDELIRQASKREIKLMLLWFATWKNNGPQYAPEWVKLDNQRFPRVIKKDGSSLNSLSPHHRSTLMADKKAFVALMKHIKKADRRQTVIMVQVENEVGTYGSVRDFSALAQMAFNQAVPAQLRSDLNKSAGSWSEVFGKDADEFFHAYAIASYVNEIAAAGKAVYPLPMNVNVALRHPVNPGQAGSYASGGPTDNVLDVWKSAAPSVDLISPDIYFRDAKTVRKVLELYSRADNPLFVSEIGNDQPFARYLYATLGAQGIGFTPFGMDNTDYVNYPLGAKKLSAEIIQSFAEGFQLLRPIASIWARLSFEGRVWGVSEPDPVPAEASTEPMNNEAVAGDGVNSKLGEHYTQYLDLGRWDVAISYGQAMFWIDPPVGNVPASGGVLIAELSENEYLVTGHRARVTFKGSEELAGQRTMLARVEEGHFDARGKWVFERVWNGDQADWGLNFTSVPHLLKVKLATY